MASAFREGVLNPNDVKKSGIAYCYNASANVPESGYGGMLVTSAGAGGAVVRQLFVSSGNSEVYVRLYADESWGAWKQV